jgi:predicted transport protein
MRANSKMSKNLLKIKDIYKYSEYFVNIALEKEQDDEIRRIFSDINTLKVDVSYPFILKVYEDYKQENITKEEFIQILRYIESYVFRRAICGIPTNSLNKTFANLYKEIKSENYLESFKAALLLKDSYRRFPRDEEFKEQLIIKDVYHFRSRNYLLRKLENYNRKELVNVESYTIEHIMPQNENLSDEWKRELGDNWKEVHKKYLHTIGNLTLTGYNSELSDRPFKEKRDINGGFADSPIRLNRSLAKLESWNEEEIIKRAKSIAELAAEIWSFPKLDQETLDKYKMDEKYGKIYTIEDHQWLAKGNPMRSLFEELRKRILNLDSSVKEEVLKLYIAYKTTTNFVDVVPQKSRLKLSLNIRFDEINDPKGICEDATDKGKWGNGDVEVGVSKFEDLDYAMFLIKQAFNKISEEVL